MSGDDIARIAYLGLLAVAIAGSYLVHNRDNLDRVAQQAAIWGLIFVGAIAAAGLWGDIRRDVAPRQAVVEDGRIVIPRGPDGHYHVTLEINGVPLRLVVDTGATDLVLSRRDAARVGLDPGGLAYLGTAQTANGTVRTATVRLDTVGLGPFTDRGLRAVVTDGAMEGSLLGMGYLRLFGRIEIADGQMILTR
ncbi:MAG: TIGR02281 family clan AA aspartic protease [Rhodobacterales bacterium]|nr:TIGR02281 family clan AA aspartic protease [Rhodobacterales bacterium]